MCHTTTPWEVIAPSLYDHALAGRVPTPPSGYLDPTWSSPTPEFILHNLRPDERTVDWVDGAEDCATPSFWSSERVTLGASVVSGDGATHCRVQTSPTRLTDTGLYLMNRARPLNSEPVTGEPAWISMRFPIPAGHRATSFTYTVNWARLFGSHPEGCTGTDVSPSGECQRAALADGESWDEEVPPGLFLLWARSSDCTGWEITGPHEPAGTVSWSGTESFTVDVPESLREVDELAVTLLVYHQYPGGCEGTYCVEARTTHSNLGFTGARLTTEEPFDPTDEPAWDHPRLFGDNAVWAEKLASFDGLSCSGAPDWSEGSTWGGLMNVRNTWDELTKGGAECLAEVPDSVWDIADAQAYLDGSAAGAFDVTRAVRMLHLIRRERACRDLDRLTCHHDLEEIDALAAAMIEVEMARIDEVVWSSFGFDFDLRTREPMRVYTILADVLWDDLSADEHALILEITGERIDAYLDQFHEVHWSIYNGNNWTPVLAEGALHWAITYFYEDERAPEVAWRALESLWLHRSQYLDDGVYAEGLLMYSQVSFDPLITISQLTEAAFDIRLDSIPWERMDDFSRWALAFMAPDGSTIDFGDSWSKRGWGTLMPLLAHMADPADLGLTLSPDPCFTHQFFSNKYYFHGLNDPWTIHPAMAQDWPSVVSDCADIDGMLPDGVEVNVWPEGGWGSARVGLPGSTAIAASASSTAPSRFIQADQVMLAVSAIPNTASHTEMDFGTVIWAPFGSRLLWDFGYGTLHGNRYQTEPDYPPDQNPTGHSTLVVPEALLAGDPSTNTSQIDGRDGEISIESVAGHDLIVLDGSRVYGRDDPDLGWLEHFDRTILALESGHIVIMDDFSVRADRPDARVSEYWYTYPEEPGFDIGSCRHQDKWVDRMVSETSVDLVAACSGLDDQPSESAGRMVATALHPGQFIDHGDISFINRLDDLVTRSRIVWEPDAPVRQDLRLFALIAETSPEHLPAAEWVWVECDDDACAELRLDDDLALTLHFRHDGLGYSVVDLSTD